MLTGFVIFYEVSVEMSLSLWTQMFFSLSNFLGSVLPWPLTSLTCLHHHTLMHLPLSFSLHLSPYTSSFHLSSASSLACPSLQLLSKMNLNTTTHTESQLCINMMAVLAWFSSHLYKLQIRILRWSLNTWNQNSQS